MPDVHEDYTEMELVEKPTIELFEEFGWEGVDAENEIPGPDRLLGRARQDEVVLTDE